MSAITSLTVKQLRRAARLKEKIQALEQKLCRVLGETTTTAPVAGAIKSRGMSAAGRARIAAAARARWARVKAANKAA